MTPEQLIALERVLLRTALTIAQTSQGAVARLEKVPITSFQDLQGLLHGDLGGLNTRQNSNVLVSGMLSNGSPSPSSESCQAHYILIHIIVQCPKPTSPTATA